MELIKSVRHRTRLSELVYLTLNLALPAVLFLLVRAFGGSPVVAIVLLVLSKWRVLAVRPRYWFINLKTNLIDLIVGVSFVYLLVAAKNSDVAQLGLVALYIAWLVYLKPKSRRHFMAMQAGIGQFVGLSALFMFSYQLDVFSVTVLAWIIGYSATRHVIGAYEEEHLEMIGVVWGLIIAELSWLAFHWTLSYPLLSGIAIPQVAAFATVLSFGAYNLYDIAKHGRPNDRRKRLTVVVTGALLLIILIFARWTVTI